MGNFSFFMGQGLSHISDVTAYDHILFIVALCAVYPLRNWKMILFLVTAFTLGHSVALALSVLEVVSMPVELIEFLIPVTILATCIQNIMTANTEKQIKQTKEEGIGWSKYGIVTFFGLIHGLGFSNYLRFILTEEESLTLPLLGFNLGLELGQLLIVGIALAINFLFLNQFKITQRLWVVLVSSIVGLMAIHLAIKTGYALYISY